MTRDGGSRHWLPAWNRSTRRTGQVVTVVCLVCLLVAAIAGFALTTPTTDASVGGERDPIDPTAGIESLHERGLTGENVTVGVVDVTGFDTSHPDLSDRVVAARSFAPGETVANGGRNDHGTAAASLVVQVAPDADLYLASFDSGSGYERAVAWMVAEEVDVVVAPVSFYGKPDDGSARVDRVTRKAATHGTLVVASAGNLGMGHWTGEFAPADEVHRFDAAVATPGITEGVGPADDPRTTDTTSSAVTGTSNEIPPPATRNALSAGSGRDLSLWLSWTDDHPTSAFALELYAEAADGARLVARSQPYIADGVPNERIEAKLTPGESYFFVVRGESSAAGTKLSVSSPTHAFEHRVRAESVAAPATAAQVLAVGAYDERTGRAEAFSGAGAAGSTDRGVDLLAPDRLTAANHPDGFVGSSAAAPYAAGVAALVLDADSGLSPREIERLLTETATDVGDPGVDPVSGTGLVEPARAVAAARNETTQSRFLGMPTFTTRALFRSD
ncbi:S8 family serine peptidase [Haloarchaeobius sp. DFWS5]|uniref:S8 family serine peptidase n=1 Tax=Haloarchaeobius sp. DFWS5 TaxID=3446114 RepID=UPI003EC08D22